MQQVEEQTKIAGRPINFEQRLILSDDKTLQPQNRKDSRDIPGAKRQIF